jgi:putative nucleotidyltransferase with HDIG domain
MTWETEMTETITPTRKLAWDTVCEFTESDSIKKHMLSVEQSMRAMARHYGEDEEKWGIVGLIHDFDYEKYPTIPEHCNEGSKILKERGWPDEIVTAVLGHASYTGVPRETRMAKALFAVDELSGFLIGCALVRPDKSFREMKVKSVRKKLKDKAFCRAVNREEVRQGAEELEWELDDLIAYLIQELVKCETDLGLSEAFGN